MLETPGLTYNLAPLSLQGDARYLRRRAYGIRWQPPDALQQCAQIPASRRSGATDTRMDGAVLGGIRHKAQVSTGARYIYIYTYIYVCICIDIDMYINT